ncbi:uncharacterized protein TNCV_4894251 [Trichonephila clavipes]|nr:uncharacterized protein TNCV_4894251 [Trichonephila clavipes]
MPPNTLRVHTEYLLVKSRGLNHEYRRLENVSLPFSSMSKLWRWRYVVLPSIVPSGIFPSKIVLSPVWCSRPRPGVLLAPCHDEFHGPRSDCVRQVALEITTT